jgi:hypothetical protein
MYKNEKKKNHDFFLNNNMMYIKIHLKKFPLAMTNLSWISIVDIKLIARPLDITHLVDIRMLLVASLKHQVWPYLNDSKERKFIA